MSFVAKLTTDTKTITNPTWADVEREIRALDARTQTLVMLAPAPPKGAPEGDHHLAVGGGGNGHFIVYTTEHNLNFWNLTDPEKRGAERKMRMNIGAQEGEYRESQFVSRDLAFQAARQYVEDGRRAADSRGGRAGASRRRSTSWSPSDPRPPIAACGAIILRLLSWPQMLKAVQEHGLDYPAWAGHAVVLRNFQQILREERDLRRRSQYRRWLWMSYAAMRLGLLWVFPDPLGPIRARRAVSERQYRAQLRQSWIPPLHFPMERRCSMTSVSLSARLRLAVESVLSSSVAMNASPLLTWSARTEPAQPSGYTGSEP